MTMRIACFANWNGFYAGGNLGLAWGRSNWTAGPGLSGTNNLFQTIDTFDEAGSFMLGLQGGLTYAESAKADGAMLSTGNSLRWVFQLQARAKAEAVKAPDILVCPNLALTILVLAISVDEMCASMVVAASIRVTSRFVTAAEVRPERAPRTPEG